MRPLIILIGGFARHGKDTSAEIIKNIVEMGGKSVLIIKYGDFLKFVAREYYGWDGEKDVAGRNLLQKLGTELARDNHPDVWVNMTIDFVKAFGHRYDYVIVPDFRYPNEHQRWIDEGYDTFAMWIHRKSFDNGLTDEQKNHRSETSLLDYKGFNATFSVEDKAELLDRMKSLCVSKGWIK